MKNHEKPRIGQYLAVSGSIRKYQLVSGSIWQYQQISGSIRKYLAVWWVGGDLKNKDMHPQ